MAKLIALTKIGFFDQNGSRFTVESESIRIADDNISSIETDGTGCIVMLKEPQKLDAGIVTGYIVTATQDQINTLVNAVAATLALSAGTVAAPSGAWADEPASGWYRIGANDYGFAVNGILAFRITATGVTIPLLTTLANLTATGTTILGGILKINGTPQTLTGAGAVNLTTHTTLLVTTAADALTLAAGAEGQYKFIRMKTDGGDGTLTVTNLEGGNTITFDDAGDFAFLFYVDAKWHILTNSGCVVA